MTEKKEATTTTTTTTTTTKTTKATTKTVIMKECDTCITEYSTLIVCTKCEYKSCKVCIDKFLCESINEPNCMSCKHPFTREFLITSMGSSWYDNKYKNTRKAVLLDREKAMFPATMEFAEEYKKNQRFLKEYITRLERGEGILAELERGEEGIPAEILASTDGVSDKKTVTKSKVYTKCPVEKCTGMLNDANECISCDAKVCSKCCEVKEAEHVHVCDPNTVETMKLLTKDTKNCPKCTTPIHRSEGCYQMWCTCCHTTFHYRTLEILTERIHNPEYTDWLKNNTITITIQGDGDCNVLEYTTFNRVFGRNTPLANSCINIFERIEHVRAIILAPVQHRLEKLTSEDTRTLNRAQFMIGKIDETKYKTLLFKSYKQVQRWSDVRDLLNMYITTLTNILTNVIVTKDLANLQFEIKTLCSYFEQQKKRIDCIYENYTGLHVNMTIQKNGVITFGENW
jgi:hypothetical protein